MASEKADGRRTRRNFTAEEKAKAVVRHLQDGVAVSEICDGLGIHPNQYYGWQEQALSGLAKAFARDDSRERAAERRAERLQGELDRRNMAVAELLTEHIALKKSLGGL
jgi:transposase-like protein